jgi:glycosyltransferase involved in cell wall biosynthesis
MKVVLATGIYPPEIGGPATYVLNLGKALRERGVSVKVIAYGDESFELRASSFETDPDVIRISRKGGPMMRWRRYAKALKETASDADVVYCFSSVSCGVPLWMAKLKHPKTVLRLGGDFLWERYTDRGGTKTLTEWYASSPSFKGMMNGLLKQFGYIIFSTKFQEELYEKQYAMLPLHSVIENALPGGVPVKHSAHQPFRLLFLGRFVSFKNLGSLILALGELPEMTLTIAGEGPLAEQLHALSSEHGLDSRITFLPTQAGDSKQHLFLDHDLLILPSYTEISPNAALEARAAGLPVLLTQETGLSHSMTDGAQIRPLINPGDMVSALREVSATYEVLADRASAPITPRTWDQVADEHLALFRNLL